MTELEHPAVVQVPRLLTVIHTAQLLDQSPRTVRRRIADGTLPAVSDHGRTMIRGDDLRRYIDALARVGHAPQDRRQARELERANLRLPVRLTPMLTEALFKSAPRRHKRRGADQLEEAQMITRNPTPAS